MKHSKRIVKYTATAIVIMGIVSILNYLHFSKTESIESLSKRDLSTQKKISKMETQYEKSKKNTFVMKPPAIEKNKSNIIKKPLTANSSFNLKSNFKEDIPEDILTDERAPLDKDDLQMKIITSEETLENKIATLEEENLQVEIMAAEATVEEELATLEEEDLQMEIMAAGETVEEEIATLEEDELQMEIMISEETLEDEIGVN